MKNKEKRNRIHSHIEGQLEMKSAGKSTIEDGNYMLLQDIKTLLEQILENQGQPVEQTAMAQASPEAQHETVITEKKTTRNWKFWKK